MGVLERMKKKETEEKQQVIETKPYSLFSPLVGNVVDIKDVNDPAFSTGMLGKGVGITTKEKSDVVKAPISGTISMLFPTLHAIGLKTDQGVEVLIHIGVDTVQLEGKGFHPYISEGQRVSRGDKLVKVDFHKLEEKGYDMTVMMIIANTDEYNDVVTNAGGCKTTDIVIEIKA